MCLLSEAQFSFGHRLSANNDHRRGGLVSEVGKCQYYSTIDLTKRYWQIPMADEDIHKTAFVTPVGCYEFLPKLYGMKDQGQRWFVA